MENQQPVQLKQKTLEEWVHSFGNEMYTWAYHKTNDQIVAEDLVQETFLAAFKAFDTFKGKSNPKTWVFSILNNKIMDHFRKSAKQIFTKDLQENEGYLKTESMFDRYNNWEPSGLESAWEDEGHLLDDPEFIRVMDICMDDLPSAWKTAVQWKYRLEKEAKEICQELEITPSNYWQILHRAKLLLKECLELKWFKKG